MYAFRGLRLPWGSKSIIDPLRALKSEVSSYLRICRAGVRTGTMPEGHGRSVHVQRAVHASMYTCSFFLEDCLLSTLSPTHLT